MRKAEKFPIKGSKLQRSYLVEFSFCNVRLGKFFIDNYRNGKLDEFIGISIFEKGEKEYTMNQTKFTVLLIYETDIISKKDLCRSDLN